MDNFNFLQNSLYNIDFEEFPDAMTDQDTDKVEELPWEDCWDDEDDKDLSLADSLKISEEKMKTHRIRVPENTSKVELSPKISSAEHISTATSSKLNRAVTEKPLFSTTENQQKQIAPKLANEVSDVRKKTANEFLSSVKASTVTRKFSNNAGIDEAWFSAVQYLETKVDEEIRSPNRPKLMFEACHMNETNPDFTKKVENFDKEVYKNTRKRAISSSAKIERPCVTEKPLFSSAKIQEAEADKNIEKRLMSIPKIRRPSETKPKVTNQQKYEEKETQLSTAKSLDKISTEKPLFPIPKVQTPTAVSGKRPREKKSAKQQRLSEPCRANEAKSDTPEDLKKLRKGRTNLSFLKAVTSTTTAQIEIDIVSPSKRSCRAANVDYEVSSAATSTKRKAEGDILALECKRGKGSVEAQKDGLIKRRSQRIALRKRHSVM